MICLLVARDLVRAEDNDDDDGAASIFHNCTTHGIGTRAREAEHGKMPVLVDQLDLRATVLQHTHSLT